MRSRSIFRPKLTEALGYFKDEGLDVELLNEPAGVDAEDQMLAGAVQGVVGFYDPSIDLQAKGKFAESVVQLNQAPGEVEMVSTKHPEIKSADDSKGRSLGVTGLGSSTNFLTQYLAVKNGVHLGDFTSVAVGAGDTFITAIETDKIQAGMTTEPTITRMMKTGDGCSTDRHAHGGVQRAPLGRDRSCRLPLHDTRLRGRPQGYGPEARQCICEDDDTSYTTTVPKRSPTKCPRTSWWATRTAT